MTNRRGKAWIHPFQTGLLVRIVVYVLVYQFIAGAFIAFCERVDSALASQGVNGHFLGNVFVRTLIILIVLVPPLAVDAIYFAHRLVGPIWRFRKTMQAIAAGQPVAPVKLRKGDLLVEFQDDFNSMLAFLEQQGYVLAKRIDAGVDTAAPALNGHPRLLGDAKIPQATLS